MSASRYRGDGAVVWLTAQTALFGAMAALLGVVANALFLDAFGAGLLPVTYIVIGAAGVILSGAIAKATERFDLLRLAVAVLGGAAALFGASWLIAVQPGGAWVSGPLLVLFPILIQLGFVFIGGQAGRILDVAGIKTSFPRIVTGFPVGAVIGGALGVPLVEWTGRTEDLLLAVAVVQAAFVTVTWLTGRRYTSRLSLGRPPAPTRTAAPGEPTGDPSLGRLLGMPLVMLVLGYQVLSAVGSQLSDYLVFDRANAAFGRAEELATFLSVYTALMNGVSIAFLFLVAGPLLRRFGLRAAIPANPLVLAAFAPAMLVALVAAGASSIVLLWVVAAGRIADVALTDGTTRTSINVLYQVLPPRPRITVQAAVEGVGVPVAIGVSGALILVLNATPAPLPAMLAVLVGVCVAWTWLGLRLYQAYGPALAEALRRARLLDPDAAFEITEADAASARGLLVSADARSVRIGLELVGLGLAPTLGAPFMARELALLTDDPSADVRLAALASLAAAGDDGARVRLANEVREAAAASGDRSRRLLAARVAGRLESGDRAAVAHLLEDDDVEVRSAALNAVRAGDDFAGEAATRALRDPGSATAAMGAIGRLGDALLPSLRAALDAPDAGSTPATARLLRAVTLSSATRDEVLVRCVQARDRVLGLLAMERLTDSSPASAAVAAALDQVADADLGHAARVLGAMGTLGETVGDGQADDRDGPLMDALRDELDLLVARLVASVTARQGRDALGPVMGRVAGGGEASALAAEALEVAVGTERARVLQALLAVKASPVDRLNALPLPLTASSRARTAVGWLTDIVEDPDDAWRAPWLRACAIRAVRLRELQGGIDLARASLDRDPVVIEELRLAGRSA